MTAVLHGLIVVFSVAAVVLAAARIARRHLFATRS